MRTNLFLSTVFILLMAGCASTKGYEQNLQTSVGLSEASLIRMWGVPADVYQSGGTKYLTYNSSRNVYTPGISPTYYTTYSQGTATTTGYGGSAPRNINYQCTTTFEITNGKISSWSYKGNDCKAPELGKDQYNYQTKMNNISRQIAGDKRYKRIGFNTSESKKWMKDLTYRFWSGKISKNEFISEGLKRYPTHEYEFKFIADRI